MDNIQNIALQTFLENIEFLKNHDEELYNKVMVLSNMIDMGDYNERYILKYIEDEKEFDICDTITGYHIYKKKPTQFIKNAVKESNFDKKSTIDLLTPSTYNQSQEPYINPLENELSITTSMCMKDIFDYIKVFQKSTVYKYKKFKYFEKFMFVGTLLGTHIKPIVDKLKLSFILIYEYNLEIFRLSLFTTNYAQLSKNTYIIFSVMEDKNNVEHSISNFFNYAFRSNFMLKYYCTNHNVHDFFERALSVSSKKTPFAFTYWKMILNLLEPSLKNMPKYPILNTSKASNILIDQPVLILAAGPSFGKNIEWIKKNQNNFFIIAIGATVKKLVEEGIKIDVITNVDGDRLIKNQFPDDIRDDIKNIPFITSPTTNKQVLSMFEDESIILLESMGGYKFTSFLVPGYSVGEVTLNTAYILGAKDIYLLGSDLALDQITGSTHADGHQHHKTRELTDDIKEKNAFMKTGTFSLSGTTLLVKGNFTEQVVSTAVFEKSIGAYEIIIKRIKTELPDAKIYNLNDGAYFEGAIPLKINDVVIKDSDIIEKKELMHSLQDYIFIGFTDEEKSDFKDSVQLVDKLIGNLTDLQKLKVKSYEEFNNQRDEMLEYIKKEFNQFSRFYLDKIFINYIFMTESYIGYQFNDKELKNEANYIKKVKKVWCEHMLTLAKKYKDTVEPIYQDQESI